MPFVKIHVSSKMSISARPLLVEEIRLALVEILKIDPTHGHVVLYDSPLDSRGIHESRDKNFVFVEILMFSGRSDEMKENLFKKLSKIVNKHVGIDEKEILINVIETDRKNWASRGGIPVSKMDLGY